MSSDAKKSRSKFTQNIGLGVYITFFVGMIILVSGLAIGSYSFELLRFHKFRDTWAILFLELDKRSSSLEEYLADEMHNTERDPDLVLEVTGKRFKTLRGSPEMNQSIASFNLKSSNDIKDLFTLVIDGKVYLAKKEDKIISLWRSHIHQHLHAMHKNLDDSVVYVINRQGQLIYSNDMMINERNVIKRPLIQNFISAPIRQSQIPFQDPQRGKMHGFFKEVHQSNVILFAETPEAFVINQVLSVIRKYLYSIGWVLLASIIIVQWPLRKVSRPLKELLKMASAISRGEFDILATEKSYGEMARLSAAFSSMASSLKSRDVAIEKLFIENQEKQRLELEMETARTIQVNFLPEKKGLGAPGIEVDGIYTPAEECAGDWFQQYYDEVSGKFYVIIADVSGHGAGSSMFTTVIATIFHQACQAGNIDVSKMIDSMHVGLQKFGKQKWHASLQVLEVDIKTRLAVLHNAGHLPPFQINTSKDKRVVKRILAPSMVIGLKDDPQQSSKSFKIEKGDVIVMMTDGLTEAKNKAKKMYGPLGVKKFLEAQSDLSPRGILNDLTLEMRNFIDGGKMEDDVCILALRVS